MKNWKQVIAIIVCMLFVIMFGFNAIIASDSYHLGTCHEEHCTECAMIHHAQNFVKEFSITIVIIFVVIIATIQLFKIFSVKYSTSQTLVNSKVQCNE
jgi:hypothetical protein